MDTASDPLFQSEVLLFFLQIVDDPVSGVLIFLSLGLLIFLLVKSRKEPKPNSLTYAIASAGLALVIFSVSLAATKSLMYALFLMPKAFLLVAAVAFIMGWLAALFFLFLRHRKDTDAINRRFVNVKISVWILAVTLLAVGTLYVLLKTRAERQVAKDLTQFASMMLPPIASDADLSNPRGQSERTSLYLEGPQFTDEGMRQLKNFSRVTELKIKRTEVTDNGFSHVKELPELTSLMLVSNSKITNAGLGVLRDLPRLTELYLIEGTFSDNGLAHLGGLQRLARVTIRNPQLTDKSLVHLKKMTGLMYLGLGNTEISIAGEAALKKALPSTRVQVQ
ncbi:MAG TPA: hypothetical protein VI895_05465 [Bdellovibrionota bacterium]|nr:hypothetical protein [Bdellovibrionota bacterium]